MYFSLLGCLSEVDTRRVFLLGLVDEDFDGFLVFFGVRWAPLFEDSVFDLRDVDFETWYFHGDVFPALIPGSAPAGTGPSLLIYLGFFSHGDVLDLDYFSVIMLRLMSSSSL